MKRDANWGWLFGLLLIVAVTIPLLRGMQQPSPYTQSTGPLRMIGVALEIYSTDNTGRFPTRLSQNYPGAVLSSPSAGR